MTSTTVQAPVPRSLLAPRYWLGWLGLGLLWLLALLGEHEVHADK